MQTQADWLRRRDELRTLLLGCIYGPLPPTPASVRWELLHDATVRSEDARLHGARLITGRVHCVGLATDEPTPPIALQIWLPGASAEPDTKRGSQHPVILHGDACWHYATDEVKAQVLSRGYALAEFNRVEIAADPPLASPSDWERSTQGFARYGAIAAWAWGFHRCVDALVQLPFISAGQIAVVGHSRGGKAALLAGATDDRLAITSANNSGAAGAGSFQHRGEDAETLANIANAFPHWFGPEVRHFAHHERELPVDSHCLKALIAPRALLTTEALGDLWANPEGTRRTHEAAREVFKWLEAEGNIALHEREGGHAHFLSDWVALLGFSDRVFNKNSHIPAWNGDSLL